MSSRNANSRGYVIGPRFFQMGSAYLQGSDLAAIARPHLEALRDAVGETAYLVVFSQGEIVQLCKADGKQAVSAIGRSMVREPAYCTATGKVLLAGLAPDALDDYVAGVELQAFTPQTITSKTQLRQRDREGSRQRLCRSTSRNSCRTCAASAFRCATADGSGTVAAISIAMPKMRFKRSLVAALVRAAAGEVGADLSATRPDRDLASTPVLDPAFLLAQCLSGLTAAMFLFIVASGLSLIFGVLRVLNFAHGSFYMLGAYMAWQITYWPGASSVQLLDRGARRRAGGRAAGRDHRAAVPAPPLRPRGAVPAAVHLRARADPRRRGQGALGHAAAHRRAAAGPGRRAGALRHRRARTTISSSSCSDRLIALGCWLLLSRTGTGRMIRAAAYDREMLAALGADVGKLYTLMFMAGSFLAGPRRRAGHAGAQHRARHGRRHHRRGLHRRGDRRTRLVLGHVPRRASSSARCWRSAFWCCPASPSSRCSR